MRLDYATIFEVWNRTPDRWSIIPTATIRFTPLCDAEATALFFELYPRRKKFDLKALPADEIDRIRSKWQARGQAWMSGKIKQRLLLDSLLDRLALEVHLAPASEMSEVHKSDTSNYRSQGYGMYTYAEGEAKMKAAMLREAGFTAEVTTERTDWGATYHVLANALPWQFDAVKRRQTVADFKRRARAAGVNAHVYNPFLPYDE